MCGGQYAWETALPISAAATRQNGACETLLMLPDWIHLSDTAQLALSRAALSTAAETIAGQAETLAAEIEFGAIADRGGPDSLRLLAAMIRALNPTSHGAAGTA